MSGTLPGIGLHDWVVLADCQGFFLVGTIQAGRGIRTSSVVEVLNDRAVRTLSGTRYRLVGQAAQRFGGERERPPASVAQSLKFQEAQKAVTRG